MSKINKEELNRFFKALRKDGFIALQNLMCCQSCGLAKLEDEKGLKKGDDYVFYHNQDKERFEETGEVLLAWGGRGKRIVDIATILGLNVSWDGSKGTRIKLTFKN